MSSDHKVSQLCSSMQYDIDTFFQELASDPPPRGGMDRGGGGYESKWLPNTPLQTRHSSNQPHSAQICSFGAVVC